MGGAGSLDLAVPFFPHLSWAATAGLNQVQAATAQLLWELGGEGSSE